MGRICYNVNGQIVRQKVLGGFKMKVQDEKMSIRLPAEMKEQIKAVAERYDMSISNAALFLLSCGLDSEEQYRPILYVTHKVVRFAEKLKDGELNGKTDRTETA